MFLTALKRKRAVYTSGELSFLKWGMISGQEKTGIDRG